MGSVPTLPTFSAGQIVTAAQLTQLGALSNFLTNPPRCALQQRTSQSVAAGAMPVIPWDTEVQDTDSMHSTSSNTSRVYANTPGSYLVTLQVAGPANFPTSATVLTELRKNAGGSSTGGNLVTGSLGSTNGTNTGVCAYTSNSVLVYLAAGDYIEAFAYQNSSGSATFSPTAGNYSALTMLWVALS